MAKFIFHYFMVMCEDEIKVSKPSIKVKGLTVENKELFLTKVHLFFIPLKGIPAPPRISQSGVTFQCA